MLTNLDLKITKEGMESYREMLGEEEDWLDKEKQIEEYQDKIDKFVKNREEIEEELNKLIYGICAEIRLKDKKKK